MHACAASITDGIAPPRELRTVATLLMLTESFGITQCTMPNAECPIECSMFGIGNSASGIRHC
jgi:hypothetical protein